MSGSYELSLQADVDLVGIWSYLESNAGEDIADKVLNGLGEKFQQLADNSGIGRPRPELHQGIRSFPAKPYVIFYRETSQTHIRIVRVLHQRQDLETAFGE